MASNNNYMDQQINNDNSSQVPPNNLVNDDKLTTADNDESYKQYLVNPTSNQTNANAQQMANSDGQEGPQRSDQTNKKLDKEKDHVKRPMNDFMVWAKEERKEIAKKNPKMHNSKISKLLGEKWKEMTSESKKKYKQEADRLKKKHMEENPGYKYRPKRKNRSSKGTKIVNQNTSINDPHYGAVNHEVQIPAPSLENFSLMHNAYSSAQMQEHREQMNSAYLLNARGFHSNENSPSVANMPQHYGRFQCNYSSNDHLGSRSLQNTIQYFHPGYDRFQQNIQPSTNSGCSYFPPVETSLSTNRPLSGSEGFSSASASPEIGLSQMPEYQQRQPMHPMQDPQTFNNQPNYSGSCSESENLQTSDYITQVNSHMQCLENAYLPQITPRQLMNGTQTSSHLPNYSEPSSLPSFANSNQGNLLNLNPTFGNPYQDQQHTQPMQHMHVAQNSDNRQPIHYQQAPISPVYQDQSVSIPPAQLADLHDFANFTYNNNIPPNSNFQF